MGELRVVDKEDIFGNFCISSGDKHMQSYAYRAVWSRCCWIPPVRHLPRAEVRPNPPRGRDYATRRFGRGTLKHRGTGELGAPGSWRMFGMPSRTCKEIELAKSSQPYVFWAKALIAWKKVINCLYSSDRKSSFVPHVP